MDVVEVEEVEEEEVEVEVVEVEDEVVEVEVEVVDVVVVEQHMEMKVLPQFRHGQVTRLPPLEQGSSPPGQSQWSLPQYSQA